MKVFLVISTCFLPFFMSFGTLGDVRLSQEFLFFFLSITAIVLATSNKSVEPSVKNIAHLVAFAYGVLGILLIEDIYLLRTYQQATLTALGLCLLAKLTQSFKYEDHGEFLLSCLAYSGLIQCLWVFANGHNFNPYGLFAPEEMKLFANVSQKWTANPSKLVVTGSQLHPNLSGAHIAMVLPAMLHKWKYVALIISLPIFVALGSAMPVGTAIFSAGCYFALRGKWKYSKQAIFGMLIIFGSLFVYGVSTESGFFNDSHRFRVWMQSLTLLKSNNWFIGEGLGWFPAEFNKHFKNYSVYRQAHNEYLEVLMAYGAVGLIGLIGFISFVIRRGGDFVYQSMFLAICFNMSANFTLHTAPLAMIAILTTAMLLNSKRSKNYGVFGHKSPRTIIRGT